MSWAFFSIIVRLYKCRIGWQIINQDLCSVGYKYIIKQEETSKNKNLHSLLPYNIRTNVWNVGWNIEWMESN